jgi:hypothetical protein
MGFLLIFVVIAVLGYLNLSIVRLFGRRRAGRRSWTALILAWAIGAGLGVKGGFFFEYRPSPALRVAGAPIPGAFFHREGPPGQEQWVDFITPAPLLFAGSNIVIVALLAACPIGLVFWLCTRTRAGSRAP